MSGSVLTGTSTRPALAAVRELRVVGVGDEQGREGGLVDGSHDRRDALLVDGQRRGVTVSVRRAVGKGPLGVCVCQASGPQRQFLGFGGFG